MKRAQETIANFITRSRNRMLTCLCFCLTLLFAGIVAQPAYAVGPAFPRYAYVVDPANGAGPSVLGYSITPASGALVPLPAGCFITPAGVAPNQAQVDPTGSFLYVADMGGAGGGGAILMFTIAPATGCLAPFIPFPTLGVAPAHVHITTNGQYLYVSDTGAGGAVEGFSIAPGTGFLAPVPGGPIPTPGASKLVIDSPGNFVYVAQTGPGLVMGFSFAKATGALAPLPCFPVPAGPAPLGMAFDEVGQFLLVTNAVPAGILTSYPVTPATGCLGPGAPIATANAPVAAAVSPFGQCAFAANNVTHNVSQYLITPGIGVPLANGAPHNTVKLLPVAMRSDPTGRYLYVVDSSGWVNGFTINPGTCALGNIAGPPAQPWAAGIAPVSIAVTP